MRRQTLSVAAESQPNSWTLAKSERPITEKPSASMAAVISTARPTWRAVCCTAAAA